MDDPYLWLQWCTGDLPPGVTSTWVDRAGSDVDPARGRSHVEDADWTVAVGRLSTDPDYLAARERLGGVVLSIVLRDDVEPEISAWTVDDEYDVTHVVLSFPADELRALPSRTRSYVEMVSGLADSAVSHLDL